MIHPDYRKVRHVAEVRRAADDYRSAYATGGPALKAAEMRLNHAVERAIAPRTH